MVSHQRISLGRFALLFAFVCLMIGSTSQAATVTYWDRVDVSGSDKHTSGLSACNAYRAQQFGQSWDHVQTNSNEWACRMKNPFEFLGYARSYTIEEVVVPPGQACVGAGQALSGFGFITNSAGQCVDYVAADLPSQCKNLGGTTGFKTVYVSFDGNGDPTAPPPLTVSGCAAVAGDVAHCTMTPFRPFSPGSSSGFQSTLNKCKIAVSFTGQTAPYGSASPPITSGPSDDGLCDPLSDCADLPPAPIENDSQPCTYVEDGEGRRVCSSSNFNYVPGDSNCGSVNGTFQCIGKEPSTNGIQIDTTVTDTTNADGSKTSVKKDTATQYTCTGAKACNATTTTNTTTTTYNSNGAKTGQSTSCTGSACATDGKGDSDGDGLSDCAVGKCEEDEDGEFTGPENEEVGSFGDSLESFMSSVQSAPIVSATAGLTVPSGGSCSFQSFTVPILGTLSFQPVCSWAADWLGPLRYLMLAVWAIVAVRTFMEA